MRAAQRPGSFWAIGFLLALTLSTVIAEAHAVGSVTLVTGTIVRTKYGQLTVAKNMVMASMAAYANGTIMFNVTGFELVQKTYQFQLQAYGNGTWNIRFWGIIPVQATANNANTVSYIFPFEQVQYTTSQSTPLVVVYGAYPLESQLVLFRDDFLYNNPLLDSSWIIDSYVSGINAGIYTSSGYAVMKAIPSSTATTMHVITPMFNPASATDGTVVKRKMTVSLVPFVAQETPTTASVLTGMNPLLTNGAYPGTTPYGTPALGIGGVCTGNAIGSDYIAINTAGVVSLATCGRTGNNIPDLESGLNPKLYTVLTIETSGVFCNSCIDHALANSSWVWFRAYQEDAAGKIVASTDKNQNFTSNIAPLFQTTYAFVSQTNSNSAATSQVTKIDLVQVQNYGSPVCLTGPGFGTLCTRLPFNPGHLPSDIIGSIAYLASLLGGGDTQAGAIIMFVMLSFGFAGAPFLYTRSLDVGVLGELTVIGFFVYGGFLPIWVLVLVFIGAAVIVVLLFQRLVGQHGGGGEG